jgi:glycosyltransferase involved in cell wall biosynthesis
MLPELPLVSVAICAFNAAQHIDATLTSVVSQTYRNLEVIIVDDGSTDGTQVIVRRWCAEDSRLRLIELSVNRGIAHARQVALEAATAEWLVFVDADDVARSTLIDRQLAAIQNDPSIIVVGVAAILTGHRGPSDPIGIRRIGPSSKNEFRRLCDQHKMVFLYNPALVARRFAIAAGGFRQFRSRRDAAVRVQDLAEDLDLWCRLSDFWNAEKVMIALPEPLVYIRKTSGSLSSANSKLMAMRMAWIKDCLRRRRRGLSELTYDEFEDSLSALARLRLVRAAVAAQHWRSLGSAYIEGNWPRVVWKVAALTLLDPRRLLSGRPQRLRDK